MTGSLPDSRDVDRECHERGTSAGTLGVALEA
jgi:hypothetical protein